MRLIRWDSGPDMMNDITKYQSAALWTSFLVYGMEITSCSQYPGFRELLDGINLGAI